MEARARKIFLIHPNDVSAVMTILEANKPSSLLVGTAIHSSYNTGTLLQLAVE